MPAVRTDLIDQAALDEALAELSSDHGELAGLDDDDHPHYQTAARVAAQLAAAVGVTIAAASHQHSAADVTSGTLADARLSSNIPRLNAATVFTGLSLKVLDTGSTPSSPAVVGFEHPGGVTYTRFDLDGGFSGIQAGGGSRLTLAAYWGVEIRGQRQTTLPTTYPGGSGADASLLVYSGQTTAEGARITGAIGQTAALVSLAQYSSNNNERRAGYIDAALATPTDAAWLGRITLEAGDYTSGNTGRREGVRVESDGSQALVGFYGGTAVARGAAVANATGAGDVVDRLNELLARIRALNLIAT